MFIYGSVQLNLVVGERVDSILHGGHVQIISKEYGNPIDVDGVCSPT